MVWNHVFMNLADYCDHFPRSCFGYFGLLRLGSRQCGDRPFFALAPEFWNSLSREAHLSFFHCFLLPMGEDFLVLFGIPSVIPPQFSGI